MVPVELSAAYAGVVADGRPQKYLGELNCWPMRVEPTTCPFFVIRLPLAWLLNSTWLTPVIASG